MYRRFRRKKSCSPTRCERLAAAHTNGTDAVTSEKGKMLVGELYNESDPELLADRARCVEALERFNATRFQTAEWHSSMADLLGAVGTNSVVRGPLMCD